MLNSLIAWIAENGLRDTAYSLCGTINVILTIPFCLWYGRKINLKFYKSIICFAYFSFLQGYVMSVIMWMNSGFREWGEANVAVAFVYLPLVALIWAKLLREPYDKISDFMAFPPMLLYGIGRFGCVFYGCCYGYPCRFGIYNPIKDTYLFPVQILETLVAFSLVILMLYLSKKRKYTASGETLPMLLTLYGIARFFIEFLHDNEKVFLGCSKIAFHALFMCAVGATLWIIKRRKNKLVSDQ